MPVLSSSVTEYTALVLHLCIRFTPGQAPSVFRLTTTVVHALHSRDHCGIAVERSTVMASKYCILDIPVRRQLASPGPLPNAAPAILLPEGEGPGARH